MENTFIQIAEGKDKNNLNTSIYKMDGLQKDLLNTFLVGRN